MGSDDPPCAYVCLTTKEGEVYRCDARRSSSMHERHGPGEGSLAGRFCGTMACHEFTPHESVKDAFTALALSQSAKHDRAMVDGYLDLVRLFA